MIKKGIDAIRETTVGGLASDKKKVRTAQEQQEAFEKKYPKQRDSLAHLKDPKTGKYDLKMHSSKRKEIAKKMK